MNETKEEKLTIGEYAQRMEMDFFTESIVVNEKK